MYFLKTLRIGFRNWSSDDLPLAESLWGDLQVTRFIGGPFSEDQISQRLRKENADLGGLSGAVLAYFYLRRMPSRFTHEEFDPTIRRGVKHPCRWRKILEPYRRCAGAVQRCEATIVSRRGICDRVIWTKPLAFAADADFAMEFQSIFAWKALPEAGFAKKSSYGLMFP